MGIMKLFGKEKNKKRSPEMEAGYRPEPEWWPDLTQYRKAMLLHNITFEEIDTMLREYVEISSNEISIECDFLYTCLPDDTSWVYLEFPDFEGGPHYVNFWDYQNILDWLSQKSDKEFCLAIPKDQKNPIFFSMVDRENPRRDSCVGIYADRDFYFEIPGNLFEWGPVPTSPFDLAAYLKRTFSFDTQWIPKVSQCEWSKTQVTLSVPKSF